MSQFISLIAVQLTVAAAMAGEPCWNQFRGPCGNGKSDAVDLPVEFDDEKNVQWKTPIHGKGWSSPVVWGDQVWLTTAPEDGTELFAVCVDLQSGQIEHDLRVFEIAEPEYCHPTNSYASCSPYVEEGRVYVHFGTHGTACLDTQTGETLWERNDLHCDHFRGPASSPIVHENSLFVAFDGIDVQFFVALDKRTGKTIWRRNRDEDIDYGTDDGDYKKAYGTATMIRVGNQWQLISPTAMETIAYDPDDGHTLWHVRHEGTNAAARPFYDNGLVYLSAGGGSIALCAVRPDGTGDLTASSIVWQTTKRVPQRSSQLVVDGRLFMVNDQGVASCLDASTGEEIWTKRLDGTHWASPIYADGSIYFSNQDGIVTVIEAGAEFKLRAKNQFPAGFNASPAVADGSLILRSFTHLYCISE